MSENIPITKIGTSDPLDICSGFGFFPGPGDPSGQTHRAYPTGMQPEWELWDTRSQLWWGGGDNDFVFKSSARIEIGVCGPNYAIKSTFHGTADNNGLMLSVEADEIAAGFFFGFGVTLTINMSVFGVGVPLPSVTLDVIRIITEYFWKDSPLANFLKKVDQFTPSLTRATGYSMFDANRDAFGANGGKYKATPTFNIIVDLVPCIAALSSLYKTIDNFLKPLGFPCRLILGPLVGIQMPVSVEVESVEIDGAKFSGVTYSRDTGKIVAAAPSGQVPVSPKKLRIFFKHTPSLTFSLGISWGLGIEKVFFLGGQVSLPVGQWLGLSVQLGTWKNPLDNTVGNPLVPSLDMAEGGDHAYYAEVIFEPAVPMA